MPRAGIVDKDALEKLSNAAIDLDTRPHELVDTIVLDTDWGTQVEKLAEIIREDRNKRVWSRLGPETGPRKNEKSEKKT
jgi:hypothetical protein